MVSKSVEKYGRGRLSLSPDIVKLLGLRDGDAFIVEADGKKILFTKLNPEVDIVKKEKS